MLNLTLVRHAVKRDIIASAAAAHSLREELRMSQFIWESAHIPSCSTGIRHDNAVSSHPQFLILTLTV